MNARNRWSRILACVAVISTMVMPVEGANYVSPKPSQATLVDVKLANGQLLGHVVDQAGRPEAATKVAVASKVSRTRVANTDSRGGFVIPVEKTGIYRIVVADRATMIRAWKPEVAPPNAKSAVLIVTNDAVRAQRAGGRRRMISILSNPAVIGVGIAASIAVPIALDDDDDDDAGSSGGGQGGSGEPAS